MRYYFASDIHLGLTTFRSSKDTTTIFLQWLDMVEQDLSQYNKKECGIFLVGDIFDFWFEYKSVIPAGYTSVLTRLNALTKNGIRIWFLPGNHDCWSKGYLEKEIGLTVIYKSELEIELGNTKFYISHGDKACAKYSLGSAILYKIFNSKIAYKLFSTLIHPDVALWFGKCWSNQSRKSKFISHSFRGEEESVVKYAREIQKTSNVKYDYFVFGHLHCATSYILNDDSKLIILGHWVEGVPVYGVFDGDNLEHKEFDIE